MKVHYFQRYQQKENVATANTLLLLSRLYSYSPDKFYNLLRSITHQTNLDLDVNFAIQAKSNASVPDAVISQESFKIVVETKLTDWFYNDQLKRHLNSFNHEKTQVLMTIAAGKMSDDKIILFEEELSKYNSKYNCHILHVNTPFSQLANEISAVLDERDYTMLDVLEDYQNYCVDDGLIPNLDSWKYMRAKLAGNTISFNSANNIYYDNVTRGFRPHDYLALYNNKSIRYIGKIIHTVVARFTDDNKLIVESVDGVKNSKLSETQKQLILDAIEDGRTKRGYTMDYLRYFFVDKFHETDFRKISPYAPRGSRVFNLFDILGESVKEMSTNQIAELLRDKTWE